MKARVMSSWSSPWIPSHSNKMELFPVSFEGHLPQEDLVRRQSPSLSPEQLNKNSCTCLSPICRLSSAQTPGPSLALSKKQLSLGDGPGSINASPLCPSPLTSSLVSLTIPWCFLSLAVTPSTAPSRPGPDRAPHLIVP